MFSEAHAGGSTELLHLVGFLNGEGLELNCGGTAQIQRANLEAKANFSLFLLDYVNEFVSDELKYSLDHLGRAVANLCDGLEADRHEVVINDLRLKQRLALF